MAPVALCHLCRCGRLNRCSKRVLSAGALALFPFSVETLPLLSLSPSIFSLSGVLSSSLSHKKGSVQELNFPRKGRGVSPDGTGGPGAEYSSGLESSGFPQSIPEALQLQVNPTSSPLACCSIARLCSLYHGAAQCGVPTPAATLTLTQHATTAVQCWKSSELDLMLYMHACRCLSRYLLEPKLTTQCRHRACRDLESPSQGASLEARPLVTRALRPTTSAALVAALWGVEAQGARVSMVLAPTATESLLFDEFGHSCR